ncbi:hypothetical protein H4Q26_002672 [Puccinia striiformis f. sp. tritici PST-130]|nr:hypothetical protein H4Q26_002672 [Puccinia striiformis f. sp. tritici PST-130]
MQHPDLSGLTGRLRVSSNMPGLQLSFAGTDIVCTSLNPTSDYKSSVLSGLPPSTILDIASRALKFWDYQQSVEASFQKSVAKQAQEVVSFFPDCGIQQLIKGPGHSHARVILFQQKAALLVQEKLNFKAQAKNEIKGSVDLLNDTSKICSSINLKPKISATNASILYTSALVLVRRLRQTENALSLEKQRAMEASDLPTTARIGKRRPEESRQSFPGVGQGHFDLRGAPGNPNIPGRYVGSITPVKSVGHHSDYYGRPQDNIRRAGAGKPHREFMSRTGYGPNETDHRFRMFAEPAGFDGSELGRVSDLTGNQKFDRKNPGKPSRILRRYDRRSTDTLMEDDTRRR